MNLSFLPRDPNQISFDSNCSLILDKQGACHVITRHIAPCAVNPTKPVSTIVRRKLNASRTIYTEEQVLLSCDNRTPLLYHYEDPRITCRPGGGYTLSVCSWGGQYLDDSVNFFTAGHQIVYTLSEDFVVTATDHPVYGYNGSHHFANLEHEKNWLPFWSSDRLHFIYRTAPHVVFNIEDEYTTNEYVTDGITDWAYGKPSGSTAPIPFDDKSHLVLFHSFTTEGVIRHYHIGAYLMENKPPFSVLRHTKLPLLSANRELTSSQAFSKQSHYFLGSTAPSSHKLHHAVVYPCGGFRSNDDWKFGCGINDVAPGILECSTGELEKALV